MNNNERARVQKGVSTGGQFAHESKSESGVNLSAQVTYGPGVNRVEKERAQKAAVNQEDLEKEHRGYIADARRRIDDAGEAVLKAYPKAAAFSVAGNEHDDALEYIVLNRIGQTITRQGEGTPEENLQALQNAGKTLAPEGKRPDEAFIIGYRGNHQEKLAGMELGKPGRSYGEHGSPRFSDTGWSISINIDPPMPPAPPARPR